MILTLLSEKGGAGKSTLACHLAAEYQARGLRVLVVDADPQGSALEWAEVASEDNTEAPDVIAVGDNVRHVVPGLADGRDVVLVDTPGRMGKRMVGALMVSDLALIPVQPGATDVWGLAGTIEVIGMVSEARPTLKAAVVINGANRTVLGRGVRAGLVEATMAEPTMRVLDTELGRRIAFAEAMAQGQGVTTAASGSVAALELRRLADEIGELLGLALQGEKHVQAV